MSNWDRCKQEPKQSLLEKKLQISLRTSLLFVFLVSFGCYSNTLSAQFVYDDLRAIERNQDLLPEKPWTNIFFNDFWGTPLKHSGSHKSYRPLCVLTFRLNYIFGKLNPWGYHFVNNILHCIVSCLFTYLSYEIYKEEWIAVLGGLMFAVHPIHTEAVASIVGRADVGAALFFLCALICYKKATDEIILNNKLMNIFWMFLCLFFALNAMYTKEQGVTVLGVCFVYEILMVSRCNLAFPKLAFQSLSASGGLFRLLFLIAYTFTILYFRFLIMGHSLPEFAPSDNPAANDPNMLTRFLTFLYLPFCNLWLLIYPCNLSYDWSMNTIPLVESILSFENILSALLYSSLCAMGYCYLKYYRNCTNQIVSHSWNKFSNKKYSLSSSHKKTSYMEDKNSNILKNIQDIQTNEMKSTFVKYTLNIMILALSAMILPFLPATNLLFYVGFVIAERILYIPSIGFCLLILNGLNVLMNMYKSKQKQIISLMAAILLMFALKTFGRNFVWRDEESLYRSGISISPAKSYGNLANVLIRQNKLKEAEEAYRAALRFRYNMADAHYNLGILLQQQNRLGEAVVCYNDAIKYRPRLAAAHLNLGVTLMTMKKYDNALKVLMQAYNISDHGLKDPMLHAKSLTHIRYNAGRILFEIGRNEEAIEIFLDAIQRMPDDYEPHSIYNMIGQCYAALKKYDYAEAWYAKSIHTKPDHIPALLTFAKHLGKTGDKTKIAMGEDHLQKAISLDPMRSESYLIYASFLQELNRTQEAINVLKEILTFDETNVQVMTLISSIYRDTEDYKKAEEYQLLAEHLAPNDPSVLLNLGGLYHLLGKLNEAQSVYTKALELDPTNALLLDNMKRLHRAMSKANESHETAKSDKK